MKYLVFLIFTVTNLAAIAQGVRVINKSDFQKLTEVKKFAFIEPSVDTGNYVYVATLQGKDRIRKSNIEVLYFEIREKANKLGANCFKIRNFNIDQQQDEVILILDAYFATDSLLKLNTNSHEMNVVFIFGAEKEDGKPKSFNLDDNEIEIKPGNYYKIILKEGDEIRLSKGGATGTSFRVRYQEDQQPLFFSISGFGLADLEDQPMNGIAFKGAAINRIGNISFGLLLTQLLKQAN